MRKITTLFLVMFSLFQMILLGKEPNKAPLKSKIVTSTKRIYLPEFPSAYNPSIIKYDDERYLMVFRYLPNRYYQHWISHIGVVILDKDFEPISEPQLLDTRLTNKKTPSQSEDARIVACNGKFYLIYNDNMDIELPAIWERRDIHIVELLCDNDEFHLSEPLKLIYGAKYRTGPWQKNWSPFEYQGSLLLSYMINPHEIITPNLSTGDCELLYETKVSTKWSLGGIRGGTPALLVDGEYLAFFHTGVYMASACSENYEMWHYYMGAYTFKAEPPFELSKTSSTPIEALGFYTYSHHDKRVIYPSGFVIEGSSVYVSYGKDDCEMWIATIDLNELKKSLVPVQ